MFLNEKINSNEKENNLWIEKLILFLSIFLLNNKRFSKFKILLLMLSIAELPAFPFLTSKKLSILHDRFEFLLFISLQVQDLNYFSLISICPIFNQN